MHARAHSRGSVVIPGVRPEGGTVSRAAWDFVRPRSHLPLVHCSVLTEKHWGRWYFGSVKLEMFVNRRYMRIGWVVGWACQNVRIAPPAPDTKAYPARRDTRQSL